MNKGCIAWGTLKCATSNRGLALNAKNAYLWSNCSNGVVWGMRSVERRKVNVEKFGERSGSESIEVVWTLGENG